MGGLRKALPFTHAVSLIGTLAIAGIPPLAGFFSKDAILLEAYVHNLPLYIIGLTVALLTAFYMMRWYLLVFAGTYRGGAHPHEGGAIFKVPLGILAALSTVGGLLGLPHFLGSNYLEEYLKPVVGPFEEGEVLKVAESTEFMLIAFAVGAALLGFLVAFLRHRANKLEHLRVFGETSSQALYLNTFYDETVGRPARALSRGLDSADAGVTGALEGSGVVSSSPGWWTVVIQNGFVRSYAASMLLGTLALMGYLLFRVLGGGS
jgi:NADH-quinone oxidoreductase subunit L